MYNNSLSQSIVKLKNEFIKSHKARSVIYEVIPLVCSTQLPISDEILSTLNNFAESNSIYFKSTDVIVSDIPCRTYEGDINDYWLSSKKYDTNYQPFYPTWILSAYTLSLEAKRLGFEEVVDIGSGDGRIAYCSKLLGMKSVGIEIDSDLVNLQYKISNLTNIKYGVLNEDATAVEYSSLNLSSNVVNKVKESTELKHSAGFNFMGSHIMKEYSRDKTKWGWGKIIKDFDLDLIGCLTLIIL